ncbi:hypothetical protein [Bacteroides sp. 224]|uniref:hypothetical protein n=1 Tax=Bacteroides sp. 224 TaxID=2302936 RepID=UPI0013D7474C|nr:hypothetical protein [Bacteroides sp. 224]NDV66110.1 hypothetical protein [Bacteroides sp. 224]
MKIKHAYSLLLAVVLLLFSCDSGSGEQPFPVNLGDDEMKMDITILTQNFDKPIDGVLKDITVLAFVERDPSGEPGEYYFAYQAINATLSPVSGEEGKWKVSAIVKKMDGKKQKFAFYGNLNAHGISPVGGLENAIEAPTVKMQDALNKYIYATKSGWGTTAGGNTNDLNNDSELFPMYGITQQEYKLETKNGLFGNLGESVYLFRMVAKLDIFLHKELTDVITFTNNNNDVVMKNAKKEGYISYHLGDNYMNYKNYGTYYDPESAEKMAKLHGLSAWIPSSPQLYNKSYSLTDFTTEEAAKYPSGSKIQGCTKRVVGNIYMHESGGYKNTADKSPVYFEFTGTPKLGTAKTYKLYLDSDILRNCHYQIVVYPPVGNRLIYTIVPWTEVNLNGNTNKLSKLNISASQFTIKRKVNSEASIYVWTDQETVTVVETGNWDKFTYDDPITLNDAADGGKEGKITFRVKSALSSGTKYSITLKAGTLNKKIELTGTN